MKYAYEIKSSFLPLAFVAGSIFLSGCESPSGYQGQSYSGGFSPQVVEVRQQRPASSDGLEEFLFGSLLGVLGVQQNVPEAVFAGDAFVHYGAGKAAKSQVNVNVGPLQNVPMTGGMSQKIPDMGPSHMNNTRVQLAYAVDRNKNGKIDYPSEITAESLVKDCSYFDEESTYVMVYPAYYYGKEVRAFLKNLGGTGTVQFPPETITPMSERAVFSPGQYYTINELKEHLLAIGDFGEGGEKIHSLEVFVDDMKEPISKKIFTVSYGELRQPSDPNITYDPKVGRVVLLACEKIVDSNKNGLIDYPEDYINLRDEFRQGEKFKITFGTAKKLRYIRCKFTNEVGAPVHESKIEDVFSVDLDVNELLPGKYKVSFYFAERELDSERFGGEKEFEILGAGK